MESDGTEWRRVEKGCMGLENRWPPIDAEPDLTIFTETHIIFLMEKALNKRSSGKYRFIYPPTTYRFCRDGKGGSYRPAIRLQQLCNIV